MECSRFGQVFSIPSRSPPTQTAGEGQRQELVDQGRQAVALLAQRAQDVAVFGGRPGLLSRHLDHGAHGPQGAAQLVRGVGCEAGDLGVAGHQPVEQGR